jgi:hypothetical protein
MGIEKLMISIEEKSALVELQKNLITDYGVEELVAFGSGVKEEAAQGGAPDLLALTAKPVTAQLKQAMLDLLAKINQDFHTHFNMLIFDKATWEIWAGQNLYQEIKKDGVQIW